MVLWLLIALTVALGAGVAHALIAGRQARYRFLVMAAAFVVVFYVGWWDTPMARCDRGDLGACIVAEGQRAAR